MFRLEKALKEWVSNALLSVEQADKIRQYEANRSGGWVLSGLITLGVVAIAIGVISLIAANWEKIPAVGKLTMDFALLVFLALGIVQAGNVKKDLLFEMLLLGFLLLCLASIGLISQIYQTGGELHQALMLWSLITAGLIFISKRLLFPLMWAIGFVVAVAFTVVDSPLFWPIFQGNNPAIVMAMPLFCAGVALLMHKIAPRYENIIRAFEVLAMIIGILAIILADTFFGEGSATRFKMLKDFIPFLPGYGLAIVSILGIWLTTTYNRLQKSLLTFAIFMFLVLFALPLTPAKEIAYALSAILILSALGVFFASLQRRRLFQFFLILIELRFLVLYFQALGGLATTGFGLIMAGILIVLLGIFWNKYKTVLAVRIERWMQ